LGSFVAISGQKPWPSAGCFVAAYRQFFMAADMFASVDSGSLFLVSLDTGRASFSLLSSLATVG
jgi:hypothetical protein